MEWERKIGRVRESEREIELRDRERDKEKVSKRYWKI